ncbi:MAG: glutathione S-transferase [Bradyrhizobium sp.]|nr:glutathione S-transferase [Bradyrhizobium sp.]
MIEFYFGPSYNSRKVAIMLEETALPYQIHFMDVHAGDQFAPEYLEINPNNKVPAIVDTDGPGGARLPMFESGAILLYLARKTGRFLPEDPVRNIECIQWLMWQMAGVGPMFGQWVHFSRRARGDTSYAIERYQREADRLRLVADRRLQSVPYLAGDYSIADMACFPWFQDFRTRLPPTVPTPHLDAWIDRILERPAVHRGLESMRERQRPEARGDTPLSEHSWNVLFGSIQHRDRYTEA